MKKFLLATLTTLFVMAALGIGYINFGASAATTDPEVVAWGWTNNSGVPFCQCDDFNKPKGLK